MIHCVSNGRSSYKTGFRPLLLMRENSLREKAFIFRWEMIFKSIKEAGIQIDL